MSTSASALIVPSTGVYSQPAKSPNGDPHGPSASSLPLPELSSLPSNWHLSRQEQDRILKEVVIPAELPSSNFPLERGDAASKVAFFLLGQTGAGKTRLSKRILKALERHAGIRALEEASYLADGNGVKRGTASESEANDDQPQLQPGDQPASKEKVLHLVADGFKHHHPNYSHCLQQYGSRLAAQLATRAAAEWLYGVCAEAARRGVGRVVVEAACRHHGSSKPRTEVKGEGEGNGAGYAEAKRDEEEPDPATVPALLKLFHKAGYELKIMVLAVPAPLSRLGTMVRYYKRLEEGYGGGGDYLVGSRHYGDTARGEVQGQGQIQEGVFEQVARGVGGTLRLTPKPVHDASYLGVRKAVEWIGDVLLNGSGSDETDGTREHLPEGGKSKDEKNLTADSSWGNVQEGNDGFRERTNEGAGNSAPSNAHTGPERKTNNHHPQGHRTPKAKVRLLILRRKGEVVYDSSLKPSAQHTTRQTLLQGQSVSNSISSTTVTFSPNSNQGWSPVEALNRARGILTPQERHLALEDISFLCAMAHANPSTKINLVELDEIKRELCQLGTYNPEEGSHSGLRGAERVIDLEGAVSSVGL
ncbi:uncharacterized protein CTHT_0070960 [Thermochaetoides thermophila DSM 1495]|uniref:Zeta toxin domain-containing protein n=1 Tax=Chaetomium thermophilum (strain DSM 1495 / CBS 144.50 / IMI 039719) TaxID=759272 RepID=G0SFI6_CHATD|nr:hypothetical protein CTHT_0070960 [Thermochaetoides thermophila DSM 1495]EGS17751.1 hypothetical protein CTHT_0070960 [Thermochaetoides thermophila DSM 1495]